MADTDTETLPNGTGHLTATNNEDEDERLKQRPADIDADVREMERRKRVEALMSSKLFREELERVLDQQMHEGNDAPLLQRIREMVGGRLHTGSLRGPSCVLPINDIRGIEGVGYEKGEKILRCKLAAVYRLVDLFGWTQTGVSGQITARLNTAVEQVLTTPRGLLPHEVTASSLVKVDMQGAVQDQGTTNFPVNAEGFSLHASVHAARPDVRCVLHVRSAAALAVSSTKRGLMPLCAEAALLGPLAQHRTPHGNLDNEERDKLVRALGPSAKILLLSSNGALCCGATLEEAFFQAKNLNAACEVQLRLGALPLDELQLLDEETRRQIYESSRKPPADASKWRVGGEEFEALMRMLDNAGFRTGYIYRHPLVKNDVPKPKNDVEVPPAVSSLGYLLEEEELYRQGLWKKGQGKTGERTRWLNSPNVYQKVEVLETGTSDPKKITKWVDANNEEWIQDGSPAHSSTPVKIDTLQFVPKNTNPKEFKQLQQQIKENRRADKISAGPQSHILEGVTWDEAARLVGEDAANTHTGDHVVLMGAASKGIIQRGYQHNATVYSAPYARNPFDHVTDREIDEYRRTVERKQRGNEYDTDLSESEAVSGAQITSPASAPSETEEESRDEHRVLRIETKQVPVRSQPELVLSDVDTTDFLKAEREHADHTREPERDPNLLSDDEVFLESTASTGTSSVSAPVASTVVVRQYTAEAFVQGAVGRGKVATEQDVLRDVLASNARTKHALPRNPNFDGFLSKFDARDIEKHPKCKLSLDRKITAANSRSELGSRSSLNSIPSIDSDGRFRAAFSYCSRSLPRGGVAGSIGRIYRTRSHSGFVNSYIRDPFPNHYHIPEHRARCSSELAYAYATSDSDLAKCNSNTSLYYSVDNIHKKCLDEIASECKSVRVTEKSVPVYKVDAKSAIEFVESQEFTEDNYLDDVNDSLSTENQTVVENREKCEQKGENSGKIESNKVEEFNGRTEKVVESVNLSDISTETVEGEYHSFRDDTNYEEAVYESPVKKLMEKDIRDYSVPIDFFCSDYGKINVAQQKSPRKCEMKTVLEPILEESKNTNSDDSSTSNNKTENKYDEVNTEINYNDKEKLENAIEDEKCEDVVKEDLFLVPQTPDITKIDDTPAKPVADNVRVSCSSVASSETGHSFDSIAEFEKFEAVSEILGAIINRINFDVVDKPDSSECEVFAPADTFSIVQIIEKMAIHVSLDSTDVSDFNETNDVVESVVHFVFDTAFYIATHRSEGKRRLNKRVVTVVDSEDILYTTARLLLNFSADENASKVEINEKLDEFTDCGDPNICKDKVENFEEIAPDCKDVKEDAVEIEVNEDSVKDLRHSSRERLSSEFLKVCDTNWSMQCQCDTILDESTCPNVLEDSERDSIDNLQETEQRDLNETFTLATEKEDMNTAFVEDPQYSRSSSPRQWNSIMDRCTESPITNADSSFAGNDITVPYEKDDTILGSPFIRRVSVISMSLTEKSGGVKYWLSFDDSITESVRPRRTSIFRFDDSKMPSFLSIDCGDYQKRSVNGDFGGNRQDFRDNINEGFDVKEVSNDDIRNRELSVMEVSKELTDEALSANCSDARNVQDFSRFSDNSTVKDDIVNNLTIDSLEDIATDWIDEEMTKEDMFGDVSTITEYKPTHRNGILLNREQSYDTALTSEYVTCESTMMDDTNCTERLLYDSRVGRRKHSSWPPYEDTVLYRIISQFRMSESFDPSCLQLDSSL